MGFGAVAFLIICGISFILLILLADMQYASIRVKRIPLQIRETGSGEYVVIRQVKRYTPFMTYTEFIDANGTMWSGRGTPIPHRESNYFRSTESAKSRLFEWKHKSDRIEGRKQIIYPTSAYDSKKAEAVMLRGTEILKELEKVDMGEREHKLIQELQELYM